MKQLLFILLLLSFNNILLAQSRPMHNAEDNIEPGVFEVTATVISIDESTALLKIDSVNAQGTGTIGVISYRDELHVRTVSRKRPVVNERIVAHLRERIGASGESSYLLTKFRSIK